LTTTIATKKLGAAKRYDHEPWKPIKPHCVKLHVIDERTNERTDRRFSLFSLSVVSVRGGPSMEGTNRDAS